MSRLDTSRLRSPAIAVVTALFIGAALGRVQLLLENERSAGLAPHAYLQLPAHVTLVLIFQPADCFDRTQPIAEMFRRIAGDNGHSSSGIMLRPPQDRVEVEAVAVNGGIDFPVVVGNDDAALRLMRRLGFSSTPVILLLGDSGEVRYAHDGDMQPTDWRLLEAAARRQ